MSKKQIILTADDYGACDFIDSGIMEALKNNKINTVTVFVTHESSKTRIENLLKLREELKTNGEYTFNIGLHFSINSGFSVLNKASSLTKYITNGKYYFKEINGFKFNNVKKIDFKEELFAQLELLQTYLGNIPIDHVSNHQGVAYLDSDLFRLYTETIVEFSLNKKSIYSLPVPIRSPISWLKSGLKYLDYDWKIKTPMVQQGIRNGFIKKIFDVSKRKLKKRIKNARRLNIRVPDYLADTIYGQAFLDNLCFLVDQYEYEKFSAEFMFHLGKKTESDEKTPHGIDNAYFDTRRKELKMLLQFDLPHYLQKHNIEKINFSNL